MTPTPPTYQITLADAERQDLARVLGLLVTKLTNASVVIEFGQEKSKSDCGIFPTETRLRKDMPHQRPVLPDSSSPSASPVVAPRPLPEPRDRWARDRHGIEVPNPVGCESHEAEIIKIGPLQKAKTGDYVKIACRERAGTFDASCWDKELVAWLANCTGRTITVYLMRKGKYLNVVGVRA